MKKIVGIRFRKLGKIYFFDPKWLQVKKGDKVIVETSQGEDIGEVWIPNRNIEESKIQEPLKPVIRLATKEDLEHQEECKQKEKEAYQVCLQKIKEHNLEMNLTDVEFKFDNSKILFYFLADGRVDFRELVKELASIYKNRIELRQIGVRDEVKRIGGNGICGRELCCCTFANEFDTVSIKMAKEQGLALNPSKISGNCGRLMCCLKYEQQVYAEKLEYLPSVGAIVETVDGLGEVDSVETLKEQVRVKFKTKDGCSYRKYNAQEVVIIEDKEKEEEEACEEIKGGE